LRADFRIANIVPIKVALTKSQVEEPVPADAVGESDEFRVSRKALPNRP
jgi:hypothetical protein